ncbi:uncharacterized protein [Amphiura filiformis]|uniref:uncharacterized protein n=1 Tax=Amphiura filiformis TaxID=82378 RepID=UPI003B213995
MAIFYPYLVFIIGFFVYSCFAQQFILQPSDAVYKAGEMATLTCGVSGSFYSHHWVKQKSEITTFISFNVTNYNEIATRYSVSNEDMSSVFILRISHLILEDAGTYFCAIYSEEEWIYSNSASLKVITEWPHPTCTTDPQQPAIGDSVNFLCKLPNSTSSPLPLTWTHTAIDFGGTNITKPGETFSVEWTMTEIDNFGHFSCFAGRTTGHGDSCDVTPLKILPKPMVKPQSQEELVSKNAEFDCVPDILHPNVTSYTWFVQGLDGYREYNKTMGRFRIQKGGKKLHIRNLTLPDDRMQIWCKAQNILGFHAESEEKATIYVEQVSESTTRIWIETSRSSEPTISTTKDDPTSGLYRMETHGLNSRTYTTFPKGTASIHTPDHADLASNGKSSRTLPWLTPTTVVIGCSLFTISFLIILVLLFRNKCGRANNRSEYNTGNDIVPSEQPDSSTHAGTEATVATVDVVDRDDGRPNEDGEVVYALPFQSNPKVAQPVLYKRATPDPVHN